MNKVTTLRDALARAHALGLERIDGQMLLLHLLGRAGHDRAWLLTHDTDALPPALMASYEALCQRRAHGEPVAYLTGTKEFYGLPLQIDARVLDPRPDTETLVDWALEVIAPLPAPRILDLGTGSGAIALALQHARPDAHVRAVDASPDALAVARANAHRLQLGVVFQQGDWLDGLQGPFDLIVSNPPYIAEGDPHLAALHHEPAQALSSGADGLDDLRTLIAQAPSRPAHGGWLLLEHGWDQAGAVHKLLATADFQALQSRTDLSGTVRCSGGQKA
ncbi:MAG: peptide chain release factor N(5)-glutamine methyltransferase [Burkholderiaceae bacterium]|nr:peptide chain release factor N(5)-glutamine methyltransferase [Burkholderiaceae bacterium]